LTYLKPWVASGDFRASYLGAELTLDLLTVHENVSKQTGSRVAIYFLLPAQDRGPVIITLSFGAFWY
jgi:hypothetical protein